MTMHQNAACVHEHDNCCGHPERRGDTLELPRCVLVGKPRNICKNQTPAKGQP
jgi:hypothetical protein